MPKLLEETACRGIGDKMKEAFQEQLKTACENYVYHRLMFSPVWQQLSHVDCVASLSSRSPLSSEFPCCLLPDTSVPELKGCGAWLDELQVQSSNHGP